MFYLEQKSGDRWNRIDEFPNKDAAQAAAEDLATYSGRTCRVVKPAVVSTHKP
jgi:hypothetical protein